MFINNYKVLESIENAISDYNNQFWKKEDQDKKINWNLIEYSEDELSANIPEEVLSKLESFSISLISNETGEEKLKNITDSLSELLKTMNLKRFSFYVNVRGSNYRNIDVSFLDSLNADILNLQLSGIDLSQQKPELFEKYKDLENLKLTKCNITDPSIISKVNPKTFISLERNQIAPEHYGEAIRLIQASNGRISFSVEELQTITEVFFSKRVQLNDYLRFKELVDFDSIPKLTVEVDDKFDFENADNEQIINLLNEKENIILNISPASLLKMNENKLLKAPTRAIIKNAGDLSTEQLLEYPCIESVKIIDGYNTEREQSEPYSREEYLKIRQEIDSIISQIQLPSDDDPDREKKIFAQIYKILGQKIRYDYLAISEEGNKDERLQITCRNMIGGLLENKSVCAGYSDILRNVLSCVDIYSEYVGGVPDVDNGVPINLKDPGGHAWNMVRLDGKMYWTDLTWDANRIKSGRYPLTYCLKSTKDFEHESFQTRISREKKDPCKENISDEEQMMLFTGKEIESKDTVKKQENKNIGYISSCVMSIANSGLTSNNLRRAAHEVDKSSAIEVINDKSEVTDGRD